MGKPSGHWLQAIAVTIAMAFGVCGPSVAAGADAPAFQLARLDADPVPARVLSGEFEDRFKPGARKAVIREEADQPRWWRLTATSAVSRAGQPQLVVSSPYLTVIETWRPGEALPVRRALIGQGMDGLHAPRALVVPLPDGLRAGQSLYLRVDGRGASVPMRVAIQPQAEVHRADLVHVAWRSAVLVSLLVLAVLSLGFWIGIRERSYAYLMATLLAVWFLVSFGAGILFRDWLDQFSIGGAPLGFWFAQQGSIYVFVVLIFVYAVVMDRIERRHGADDQV